MGIVRIILGVKCFMTAVFLILTQISVYEE